MEMLQRWRHASRCCQRSAVDHERISSVFLRDPFRPGIPCWWTPARGEREDLGESLEGDSEKASGSLEGKTRLAHVKEEAIRFWNLKNERYLHLVWDWRCLRRGPASFMGYRPNSHAGLAKIHGLTVINKMATRIQRRPSDSGRILQKADFVKL